MQKKKLLIVDDEADIRMLLKEYLELEGYQVLTAASADEADQALIDEPGLILRREKGKPENREYAEGDLSVDFTGYCILINGRDIGLTKMEFQIAELLFTNKGQVFTKENIYEEMQILKGIRQLCPYFLCWYLLPLLEGFMKKIRLEPRFWKLGWR